MLLATGGRPHVPNIPGKELAITSDDIFWRRDPPGKTLCIGASYISLETAGFLHEMGYDVTIMVRSILLRGFDRECSNFVGDYMEKTGVKFLKEMIPKKLEKYGEKQIKVTYGPAKPGEGEEEKDSEYSDIFDTVMFATGNLALLPCFFSPFLKFIGRKTRLDGMNLDKTGVEVLSNGFINVNNEQTNVPNIFAVGDLVNATPELTPVAIQAGKLLSKRLFAGSKTLMDYVFVATTVFTPLEYSCCGYSEDEALEVYGDEDIEIYHEKSNPLEHYSTHRVDKDGNEMLNTQFVKIICVKSENERIVGFHYCGPNAGEVMQGFSLALKFCFPFFLPHFEKSLFQFPKYRMGATKAMLDNVVGIHPTSAERFTTLNITKASGESAEASAC